MLTSKTHAPACSLFLLGQEGVLLHSQTRRIYYLNTVAVFIWCCLDDGLNQAETVDAICAQFGIPPDRARRDVAEAIHAFQNNGLIGDASGEHWREAQLTESISAATAERHNDASDISPRRTALVPQAAGARSLARRYRLGDAVVHIVYPSIDVGDALRAVMGHLETQACDDHVRSLRLDIVPQDAGYAIYCDGQCKVASLGLDEIVTAIQRDLLMEAYERSGCLLGVHAGAMGHRERCILLPGRPGSGKSTLTAALMHAGFTYLTDELVLVMPEGYAVQALPVSLGLKQGAWAVLSPRFPEITHLRTYVQADRTAVRYLRPRNLRPPGNPECTVMAVVFPEYEAGTETQLSPLTTGKAIYRLSLAGYAVPDGLTPRVLQAVIDWIRPIPCFALRFDELDAGVEILSRMLTEASESGVSKNEGQQPGFPVPAAAKPENPA